MSRSRLVSSYLSMGAVLAGATWMSVIWFPMRGLPQLQTEPSRVQVLPRGAVLSDAPGVTVKSGGGLLHRQGVQYPRAAAQAGIGGTVVVDTVLDQSGNVTDARVLSGPDQLRRAALESILQWHFTPEMGRGGRAQVTIDFAPPPPGSVSTSSLRLPPPPPPPPGVSARPVMLNRVDLSALPQSLQDDLRPRLQRFEGRPHTFELINEIRDAVTEVEPHMSFTFQGDTLRLMLAPATQVDAPPAAEFPPAPDGTMRIRVGGNVQSAKLSEKQAPLYPALARQARIQGVVRFGVLIDAQGGVKQVQLISGHPLLVPNAMEAVSAWKYQPTLLNGNPVEVVTQVDINFTLAP